MQRRTLLIFRRELWRCRVLRQRSRCYLICVELESAFRAGDWITLFSALFRLLAIRFSGKCPKFVYQA